MDWPDKKQALVDDCFGGACTHYFLFILLFLLLHMTQQVEVLRYARAIRSAREAPEQIFDRKIPILLYKIVFFVL